MADREEIRRLADLARSGDRAAFSELVKKLMNPIFALTYRLTGQREAALDLTQETFVSVWENIERFRGEAAFETWLYRIAMNKCLNFVQSQKQRSAEPIEAEATISESASPERELWQKELKESVLRFMQSLPEQQRVVFELRFYRQLSFHEIAEVTEKALGTVKTLYREAIKKLREHALQRGWQA